MAKKTLNIIESAYRAVQEEQDDTILWVLAAMQGAGADHTVVLRGNAVNYAVAGQGAPALAVGEWKQTQPPKMDRDLVDLMEKRKIPVYVIEEDVVERGIDQGERARREVPGARGVAATVRGTRARRALVGIQTPSRRQAVGAIEPWPTHPRARAVEITVTGEAVDARFVRAPTPTLAQLEQLVQRVAVRVRALVGRAGAAPELPEVSAPMLRVFGADAAESIESDAPMLVASYDGFNLHAATAFEGNERMAIERWCRYALRLRWRRAGSPLGRATRSCTSWGSRNRTAQPS